MNNFFLNDDDKTYHNIITGKNVFISNKCSFYNTEIIIGNNVRIDDFSIFKGKISIGDNVHIGSFCSFNATNGEIKINNFTGVSNGCYFYTATDDFIGNYLTNPTIDKKYKNIISGNISIGQNVSIGAKCVILPNSNIGDNVSISALSVINGKYEDNYIYIDKNRRLTKTIKKNKEVIEELMKKFKNEN